MSYSIKGNTITLTRGDTFVARVGIYLDGEEYLPQDDDVVRFALKHKEMTADKGDYADEEPLLTVVIPNDTLALRIESEDTKTLDFGDYVYDIQITFADGSVDTFITPSTFRLTPEVD